MKKYWDSYYRSTNGHLAKTNREVGKLLYGLIFIGLFAVGFKIWGLYVGLIMGVVGDIAYALVWFLLKSLKFWDH